MTDRQVDIEPGERVDGSDTEELGKRARILLEDKGRTRPRRPLVVEFSGSPKAGKSTVINALSIYLRRNGFKVRVMKEYASDCPIRDKTNWLFNLWTSVSTVRHLAPHLAGASDDVDVLLLDRGIFDSLCWLTWLEQTQRIDSETHRRVAEFLRIDRFRAAIDLVLTFPVAPDVSIKRENANLLTKKGGTIMNATVLQEFLNAMSETRRRYAAEFPFLEEIDSLDRTPQETTLVVTRRLLEALTTSLKEKVGYFRRDELKSVFGDRDMIPFDELARAPLKLDFEDRRLVETEDRFVQPVVVAVITNRERDRVALWRKSIRSLGTDSPEEGRALAYLGGHVRVEDSFERKSSEILGVLDRALERELSEEIGQVPRRTRISPFCIWDRSGPVKSKRHMGIVYVYEVDFAIFEPVLDRWEFDQRSFSAPSVDEVEREQLEKWSSLIMELVFPTGSQEALFSVP